MLKLLIDRFFNKGMNDRPESFVFSVEIVMKTKVNNILSRYLCIDQEGIEDMRLD